LETANIAAPADWAAQAEFHVGMNVDNARWPPKASTQYVIIETQSPDTLAACGAWHALCCCLWQTLMTITHSHHVEDAQVHDSAPQQVPTPTKAASVCSKTSANLTAPEHKETPHKLGKLLTGSKYNFEQLVADDHLDDLLPCDDPRAADVDIAASTHNGGHCTRSSKQRRPLPATPAKMAKHAKPAKPANEVEAEATSLTEKLDAMEAALEAAPAQKPTASNNQGGDGVLAWYYLDSTRKEFGPFPNEMMRNWFVQGFFPLGEKLLIRLPSWRNHVALRTVYPDVYVAFIGPPRPTSSAQVETFGLSGLSTAAAGDVAPSRLHGKQSNKQSGKHNDMKSGNQSDACNGNRHSADTVSQCSKEVWSRSDDTGSVEANAVEQHVSEKIAHGFLEALRAEYVHGHAASVGTFFDDTGVSDEDQGILNPYEEKVRDSDDKEVEINNLAVVWGLDIVVESIAHGCDGSPFREVAEAQGEKPHCHNCHKDIQKPLRCGVCKRVTYCSAQCQRDDWTFHKRTCRKPGWL
jgi:hypothetical protein